MPTPLSAPDPAAKYPPRLVLSTALAVTWAVLPALAGFVLIARLGTVNAWLAERGDSGIWIYAAGFAIASGLGLLPTYACAVLGGWAFGMTGGLSAALGGFVGGATIGFVVARLIGGDAIRDRIDRHPRAAIFRRAFVERGFGRTLGVVALLRMPPNSPFALTNLAMAGSGVRYLPFVLGTAIGMLPRTAVTVAIGAAGKASGAADIQEVIKNRGAWYVIAAIVGTVIVLGILGAMGNAAAKRLESGMAPGRA